jgi:hypothetical protein
MEDFRGSLHAETQGGRVTARSLEVEDLRIRAGLSDVRIDGLALSRGSGTISADKGEVVVKVDPSRSSFKYRLRSEGGDVRGPVGEPIGNAADGRIGSGEGVLTAESVEGDVILAFQKPKPGRRVDVDFSRDRHPKGWAGLFSHLGVFVIVCGALMGLNVLTNPEHLWAGFVALCWGVGLGIHAWGVVVRTLMASTEAESAKFIHIQRSHRHGWDLPWTSLVRHLGSYVAVIGFLLFVNLYTGPHNLWVVWPAGAWGVGLAIHAWVSFVRWVRGVWDEKEERTPPVLEAVEARRARIMKKWGGFFGHLGTYVIVNGFLVILDTWGGDPLGWSLFVLGGWGIGVFMGFWGAMVDTMVYISMEKAYRRGEKGEAPAPKRYSLVLPSLFNAAVLLAVAFLWFAVPMAASHTADLQAELPEPALTMTAAATKAHAHPVAFWGAVFALLGLSFGFYFGTGARGWIRLLYVLATVGIVFFLGMGSWFALVPLL